MSATDGISGTRGKQETLPWVKINISFLKKMVKVDCNEKGEKEVESESNVGMWRSSYSIKQGSGMKIERQRKKGDRQREGE